MSTMPGNPSLCALHGAPTYIGSSAPAGDGIRALNHDELLQRCLGNVNLFERVLLRFNDEVPKDISRLEELAVSDDAEEFRRLAHKLKGSAANIAAPGLLRTFANLEVTGSHHKLADADEQLQSLALEWTRFQAEVRTLLQGNQRV